MNNKGPLLWFIGLSLVVLFWVAAGSNGFEHWFNQFDAPTDGKDDPDTIRDRMSINNLRWSAPETSAHAQGRIELFNGNSFPVRDIRLTCMRSGQDGSVDTTEELHAVIPGPLKGRTRKLFEQVDLGGPLKGAAAIGCILTRAQKATLAH